ncbi:hypothetical protein M569_10519 [Genlisea aurea]|uniref:J domain-containing protein n=1 Tax=Genlisea aurea TaxID=192259 RepID=S8DWE3_9LAMI|nr:hypothetical protein M569_10519 [Genlisea aurea]
MQQHSTTSRAEAERLLGLSEKLLQNRDFAACRDFAILAQETEPLLEGPDQILAITDVLLASESKKVAGNRPDWYAILQVPHRTDEAELIKKQYRRLALLLHPDKNKLPFSDSAFRLVADSWAVLSDPAKKLAYDTEFAPRFTKVDLVSVKQQKQKQKQPAKGDDSHQKLPVRRSARGQSAEMDHDFTPSGGGDGGGGTRSRKEKRTRNVGGGTDPNFWTTCPYCYNLYEYPRIYDGCCLRCDNCKRAFTAAEVLSMPPIVPGKEAYYCCWGFFPVGFTPADVELGGVNGRGFTPPQVVTPISAAAAAAPPRAAPHSQPIQRPAASTTGKKRGRPRKNP